MRCFALSCLSVVCLVVPGTIGAKEFGEDLSTVEIQVPPTFVDVNGPIGDLPRQKFDQLDRGFVDDVKVMRPLRTVETKLEKAVYDVQISDLGNVVYFLVESIDHKHSLVQFSLENQSIATFPLNSEHHCTFQPTFSGFEIISQLGVPLCEVNALDQVSAPRQTVTNTKLFDDRLTGWRTINGADVGFLSYPWGVSISRDGFPVTIDRTVRFYVPNPISPGDFFTVRAEPKGLVAIQLDSGKSGLLAPLESRNRNSIVLSDRMKQFYVLESSTTIRTAILKYPANSRKGQNEFHQMKVAPNGIVIMSYGGTGSIGNRSISGFLPVDVQSGVAGAIHYFSSPGGTGFSAWDVNALGTFVGIVEDAAVDADHPQGSTVICLYQVPETFFFAKRN